MKNMVFRHRNFPQAFHRIKLLSNPSRQCLVGLLSLVVALLAGATVEGQLVRDIPTGQRQLFLDDWVVSKTENIQRQQGKVTKNPDNPIIRRDKPWDASRTDLYGSVVYDPENKRIQLFYAANNVPNGHEDRLAYAESRDGGKTWVKPEFDHVPFREYKRTNLVMLPPSQVICGPCVFRDEHETDPAKRYKLFTSSYPDTAYLGIPRIYEHRGQFLYAIDNPGLPPGCDLPGLYVAYSPDGIHWQTPAKRISNMMSDTSQSAFWDARIRKYIAYVRARTKNDRSVARMESNDFETWSDPQVVLEGTPAQCLYSMGTMPYEGIYIGTPWIFDQPSESRGGPVIWPELAVSRDGINWTRPFPSVALIPTGAKDSADSRQIRLANSWVVLGDKILFCYGQSKQPHTTVDMQIDIGMATLRRDGFAAMTAGEKPGKIVTKLLRFKAGQLWINAQTEPDGFIKAEIVDAQGKPLPGYKENVSIAFAGDSVEIPLGWNEKDTIPAAGNSGNSIRFLLKNAKLYAFWIKPR
jgi:hypothetical protein